MRAGPGLRARDRALADRPHHVEAIGRVLPCCGLRRLIEAENRIRLAALLDGDVESRESSLRRLHHQLQLARLADEVDRVAGTQRLDRLAARPDPRDAAADDREKDQEGEELAECSHLVMILPVVTFSGSPQDAPESSRGQDTWFSATADVRKRFAMAVSSNG